MPRHPRLDAPGTRHHVMNRGARRDPVFLDDESCARFLALLAELPDRFSTSVHGYALMPNHFHVLLRAGPHGLGAPMRYLQGEYSRWLNGGRGWDGPVWRSRYQNRLVESDDYWRHLLAYVNGNPVRGGLVPHVDVARWTSHEAYAGLAAAPEWLDMSEHLELFGDVAAYREYLAEIAMGRDVAPDGFDPDALFGSSERVLPVAVERQPRPRRPEDWPMTEKAAWLALRTVTGATAADLAARHRGRGGNPEWWLALWWLPVATNQTPAEWAARLEVSRSSFTRARARLAERVRRDPRLAGWRERLKELLPPGL